MTRLALNIPQAFAIQAGFCQNLRVGSFSLSLVCVLHKEIFHSFTGKYALENLCYTRLMPPVLRASDIGTYLYCRRAWMYRNDGVESENRAEMATGTELHRRHGRKVLVAGLLRTLGLILLLIAMILLVIYLTNSFLK
jgi:hypothetical protein